MAAIRLLQTVRYPIVVILGSTGTGKSKLAIDLALKFNGEIISADAMQIYKGLDIITNKVTEAEQLLCKHHMIAVTCPTLTNYTVVEFQRSALHIIEDLHKRDKLPVIVGGTNYYIESLLWNILLPHNELKSHSLPRSCKDGASGSSSDSSNESYNPPRPGVMTEERLSDPTRLGVLRHKESHDDPIRSGVLNDGCPDKCDVDGREKYQACSNDELYAKLMKVDQTSALRIHPHNRRKVIRALEVYDNLCVTATELYAQQHNEDGAISGDLRFPEPCVIYLQSDQSVLDKRLDARVDSMIEQGLVDELLQFHRDYNAVRVATSGCPLYTEGIFQSIGFKEFHHFLLLPKEERHSDKGRQLFNNCVEEMKRATRRYCRYQIKWVNKRFLTRRGRSLPPVYGLDVTDPSAWDTTVSVPATSIVHAYLQGEPSPMQSLPVLHKYHNRNVYNTCQVCGGKVFVTQHDWTVHLSCRRHKRRVAKQKRRELKIEFSLPQPTSAVQCGDKTTIMDDAVTNQ